MKLQESQSRPAGSTAETFPVGDSLSLPSEEYTIRALPGILRKADLTATFVIIIFFITNVAAVVAAGPSALTYFALGAIAFFIPSIIVTAQLGVMFPYEGSLYNWTHRALGGYWSFFVAFEFFF